MKSTIAKRSPLHGKGLFAARVFRKNEVVEQVFGKFCWRQSKSKYAIRLKDGRSFVLEGKCRYVNAALPSQGKEPNVRISLKRYAIIALCGIGKGDKLLAGYESPFQ